MTGHGNGTRVLVWHRNSAEGHYTNGAHHRYHITKHHRRSWTVTVYAVNRHLPGITTRGPVAHVPSPFDSLAAAKNWAEHYETSHGQRGRPGPDHERG